MSRDIPQALLDELDKKGVRYTILGRFDFSDVEVFLWTGPRGHSVDWDGQTWVGVGDLGNIDKITEPGDLRSARTVVSIRMTSDMLDRIDVNGEANRGRDADLRVLFFDDKSAFIDEVKIPYTMGGMELKTSVSDQQGERIVIEEIELTLLGRQELLGRTFFRTQSHQDTLEIDSDDFGNQFASDPDMGVLGGALSDNRSTGFPPIGDDPQLDLILGRG